jgi:hypothetical protein
MDLLRKQIGDMISIIGDNEENTRFTLFNKTVADWLLDEKKSRKRPEEQVNKVSM